MINPEKGVDEYYQKHWAKFVQWWNGNEAQAIHVGLYEKGIRSHVQALNNMNDYVAILLHLNDGKTSKKILDAGCGVGGTITYLAQKYPCNAFFGITITKSQVELAKKLATERKVINNTKFLFYNYRKTDFPDEYFDGVFTIESINYAKNKQDFVNEMYRILKPNGKIVISDAFLRDKPLTPLTQKLYEIWRPAKGYPTFSSVNSFTSLLKDEGFNCITFNDITNMIHGSVIRASIIGFPYFWASLIKRFIQLKKYKPEEDINYFMGAILLEDILGLIKIFRFCSVVAVKPL